MLSVNYFKKYFIFFRKIAIVVFAIPLFISCNKTDSEEKNFYQSYLCGTYQNYSVSGENKLILFYNDIELKNNEVTFFSQDNKKGSLTFSNILPNERESKIENIDLVPDEENNRLLFEGIYNSKSSKNVKYSGYIFMGTLSLNLSDK